MRTRTAFMNFWPLDGFEITPFMPLTGLARSA